VALFLGPAADERGRTPSRPQQIGREVQANCRYASHAICLQADLAHPLVMPALVAGIHVLLNGRTKDVDGRNKSGHDDDCSPRERSDMRLRRRGRPQISVRSSGLGSLITGIPSKISWDDHWIFVRIFHQKLRSVQCCDSRNCERLAKYRVEDTMPTFLSQKK
jgi:hypothetical protein